MRDVRDELAQGRITAEEATRRFDILGATPEQRANDTRSEEVRQLDEHFPPAKESDFIIPYYPPGQAPPVLPKPLAEFDRSARAWLAGAQFDRTLGNSLVTQISRVAQLTKTMTPDQLDTYGEQEYVKLQAAYKDTLEDKLRQTGRMVEDLGKKQPGLKNLLRSKGIGDSALVASILIGQSEIYWARRKGR